MSLKYYLFTDTYQWSVLKNQNVTLINELLPRLLLWRTAVVYNDLVWETLISFLNLIHQLNNLTLSFMTGVPFCWHQQAIMECFTLLWHKQSSLVKAQCDRHNASCICSFLWSFHMCRQWCHLRVWRLWRWFGFVFSRHPQAWFEIPELEPRPYYSNSSFFTFVPILIVFSRLFRDNHRSIV